MQTRKEILKIPNIITLFRILIVFFAAMELLKGENFNSIVLYLAAGITDFFDGFFARYLNQISELGKTLDPIADKLMIGSAVIILFLQGRMPIWFVALFLGGSLFNLLGGFWISRKIKFVMPSIMIGKIAAVCLMLTFGLNIGDFEYINYVYYLSAILTIISIIFYVKSALKELENKNKSLSVAQKTN